ncbi:MAG TPA: tetratricopeptide repeat protein [Deltaproteobacteria bacterium]|nr:tetratricopeptide repeat protein [Deltaproteobacteria bacterium]
MVSRKDSKEKSSSVFLILCLFLVPAVFFSLWGSCHAVPVDTRSRDLLKKSLEDIVSSHMLRKDPKASLLVLAEVRLKQGLWQDAAGYASALISMDTKNMKAHGVLGVVCALAGDRDRAYNEMKLLKDAGEQGVYPDLIQAIMTAHDGKFGEAEGFLTDALKKDPGHPVAVYYSGNLCLMQGKIDEAETAYKRVIAVSPDFPAALAGLGRVAVRHNQRAEAVSWYEKALDKEPGNLSYRRELINIHKSLGRKDAADNEMKLALYYMPGVRESRLKQGMQLLMQGEYSEAVNHADMMLSIYKDIPEALYIKAAAQINLNKTDPAVKNVQSFVSRQWGMAQAHHYAGMCYLALDRLSEAEKHFQTVIMIDPWMGKSFIPLTVIEQLRGNNRYALQGLTLALRQGEPPPLIRYLMGHIKLATGDTTGYQYEMKGAVGLMPGLEGNADFYVPMKENVGTFTTDRNLMVLFFYNGWHGKTINAADTLLKINKRDPFAWYYRALSLVAHQKMNDALHAFRELARIKPDLSAAHMGQGRLYLQIGKYEEAATSFRKVVTADRENEPGHVALGDALAQQGLKKEAITSYKMALTLNPERTETYLKLAAMFSEDPAELSEALQYALKAEELAPGDPSVEDVIGWIYVKQGDVKNALEKLHTASKALPLDPVVQYHLGVAYYKNGEHKQARAALQEALKISRNFSGADDAIELLKKISE